MDKCSHVVKAFAADVNLGKRYCFRETQKYEMSKKHNFIVTAFYWSVLEVNISS